MHAVVVSVTIHDFEAGRRFLEEQVVPRVSQAPGFVAGYWVRLDGDRGRSVVVYESEEAARTAADQIASPPPEAIAMESVDVGEVVAHA
jgi:hypothetical protein